MKKLSLTFLGAALLVISCQKNEKMLDEVPLEEEVATESARKCASHEILEEQLRTDSERARRLEELERKTATFQGNQFRTAAVKLYIPVVVNVILPDASIVTDAQIQRQLDVLNADFNKANAELSSSSIYLAGYDYNKLPNCDPEFYIKDWSPGGDVNRKNASGTFGTNDAVKKTTSGGLDPESPTIKMNIWVCDLSNGLLGYAQFPGGAAATDGVVIDYQAFGTKASYSMYSQFNLGRTATHEVGHWLNLRHIWGDTRCGNDYVGDTPAHDASNGGCPAVGLQSRCAGKPLEQWMNYMDYTDDRCMYMFSAGQKARMDLAIDGPRATWVTATEL